MWILNREKKFSEFHIPLGGSTLHSSFNISQLEVLYAGWLNSSENCPISREHYRAITVGLVGFINARPILCTGWFTEHHYSPVFLRLLRCFNVPVDFISLYVLTFLCHLRIFPVGDTDLQNADGNLRVIFLLLSICCA